MLNVSFQLAPEKAVEFFRGKGLAKSFAWQDMLHEEHDREFTVAKMMDLDLLSDVKGYVDRAISEGWTRKRFIDELRPELVRRGWWGRATMKDPATGEEKEVQLGSVRRLNTIYDTNLRTAYTAGHWAKIRENAAAAPYVMYSAILDARTRPQHRAWNGKVLRHDDPWLKTHTPPNGWNCRCTVIQLSERDLKKLGKSGPDEAPPVKTRDWTNPRTGEILQVPEGIDPGFGYAPGASRRSEIATTALDKIAAAPADLGATAYAALQATIAEDLRAAFRERVRALAAEQIQGENAVNVVTAIAPSIERRLAGIGITLASAAINATDGVLAHMTREAKLHRGAALPIEVIEELPAHIDQRQAVLWDLVDPALVYVFNVLPDEPRLGKAIVRVNYATKVKQPLGGRKTVLLNQLRTGGLVQRSDLTTKRYELWEGKL